MRNHFNLFILACLLVLLAACATSTGGTTITAASLPKLQVNTTIVLQHAPQGTVEVTFDPKKRQLLVGMRVSGLTPNSVHPTHIHTGTCSAPGAILYLLPLLKANTLGQATLSTVIKNVAQLPTKGFLLNIHNGPTMAAMAGQNVALACAPLTMKKKGTIGLLKEQVRLQGTAAPNGSAHGIAQVFFDLNRTLKVTVSVQGLLPGSRHAVHVHAGSCEQQGKMLYPLPNLVADANGDARSNATFSGVGAIPASGWYINVHFGQAIATPQGQIIPEAFSPIACGNVGVS